MTFLQSLRGSKSFRSSFTGKKAFLWKDRIGSSGGKEGDAHS